MPNHRVSRVLHLVAAGATFVFIGIVGSKAEPNNALLRISGVWAENFNLCVEPTVITIEDNNIRFYSLQPATNFVARILSVEGDIISTEVIEPDSEKGAKFFSEIQTKTMTLRRGDKAQAFVKCQELSVVPTGDPQSSCNRALKEAGEAHQLLQKLNTRLEELGLSSFVRFQNVLSSDRGCSFNITIHPDADKLTTERSSLCNDLLERKKTPAYVLPTERLLSLNYQNFNKRGPFDAAYEECFEEAYGMSIWDKLLVSISNTILIPLHDIELIAPTTIHCQQFYVYYQAGAARFLKAGCMSGMSAQRTVLVPSAGITPAAMAKAPPDLRSMISRSDLRPRSVRCRMREYLFRIVTMIISPLYFAAYATVLL